MTNVQLLHVMAAVLGEILGRALSPEFFIPVAVAAYHVRTFLRVLVYSAICAVIGSAIFLAVFASPEYLAADFCLRYLGSVLIITLVYIIKVVRRGNSHNRRDNRSSGKSTTNRSNVVQSVLFSRPDWLEHEGIWRVMQALRLGMSSILLIFFAIAAMNPHISNWTGLVITTLIIIPGAFFGIHYSFRLVVWIKTGFSDVKRS